MANGVPPFSPKVVKAIRWMAQMGLPMQMSDDKSTRVIDEAAKHGLVVRDGHMAKLTPEGWAHTDPFELFVTKEEMDAIEVALQTVDPDSEQGVAYVEFFSKKVAGPRSGTATKIKWKMSRADAAELYQLLDHAVVLWSEAARHLKGSDRDALIEWSSKAEDVQQRLSQSRFYDLDDRDLLRYNDPEVWEEAKKFYGGYDEYRIEIVPISDVDVQDVWNPRRFEDAFDRLRQHLPTDPIHASLQENGKWDISDGIHRTNASIALGYSHVPVLTYDFVATPEALIEEIPELPRLSVGEWVKLSEPFGGAEYGWVSERLAATVRRGTRRWCYGIALVMKGSTWPRLADFCDHEFEVVMPPTWAIRAKTQSERMEG